MWRPTLELCEWGEISITFLKIYFFEMSFFINTFFDLWESKGWQIIKVSTQSGSHSEVCLEVCPVWRFENVKQDGAVVSNIRRQQQCLEGLIKIQVAGLRPEFLLPGWSPVISNMFPGDGNRSRDHPLRTTGLEKVWQSFQPCIYLLYKNSSQDIFIIRVPWVEHPWRTLWGRSPLGCLAPPPVAGPLWGQCPSSWGCRSSCLGWVWICVHCSLGFSLETAFVWRA